MIAGFAGQLVAERFLEGTIADHGGSGLPTGASRPLLQRARERSVLGPSASPRAMFEAGAGPVLRALGFVDLAAIHYSDRCVFGVAAADRVRIGIVATAWGERLDRFWTFAVTEARRHGLAWCLLFNGTHIRVVDPERLHSRRYAELDLDAAAEDDGSFAALVLIAAGDTATLVAGSDRYAAGVCRTLRDGVLEASEHLLGALASRRAHAVDQAFEQALTIVYRILFLLFAEARGLVPLWHPVYRESYSIEGLRDAAVRGDGVGLWDALRAVSRLAHAGCRAGDLRVTPFNGRLFAPARTPLVERRDLDDHAARQAVVALSTRPAPDGAARESISYRDLGVEQLGSVYETLLDYAPAPPAPAQGGGGPGVRLRRGSGVRKATGTFYTPQSIAQYLVRDTLGPLTAGAQPDHILGLKVLDPSMGSGAFLVAACAYLADAYENALVESGGYHATDFGPGERIAIRRTIAERCLYGVDVNPMAVQLARLSLWLASLAADRPLGFLDHHLVAGDSILGAWLACLRQPPRRRRQARPDSIGSGRGQRLSLFDDEEVAVAMREVLPVRFDLARGPSDTPQQVHAKERALAALSARGTALSKWKRIADLWCARWFGGDETAFQDLCDVILTGSGALPASTSTRRLEQTAAIAARRRFVHWELEFPEVFFDAGGRRLAGAGFDAVIGNPPWDMVRDDGASAGAANDAGLAASIVRFTRDSGVYAAQSDGHANRYQMFLERAIDLSRAGGRIGLVLPSGLATDHGSARLRRLLFSRCDVDAIVGFENRRAIFPIHRSVRFLLLTASHGTPTRQFGCRFGETDPTVLETRLDGPVPVGTWCPIVLTTSAVEKLSGDGMAIPELRSPVDLQIAERAATLFAPSGGEEGWRLRFGRELNATADRQYFHPRPGIPVIEGKLIEPFRVDRAGAVASVRDRDASRLLGERWRRARLAYRDVAGAGNRRTFIAAILPAGCVSTHTLFCLRTPLPPRAQQFLCALFNSLVVNYLVRMRMTTHVTTAIVERLPVPREDQAGALFGRMAAAARVLQNGPNADLEARLNAWAAMLYQLSAEEFAHVLDTFPLVPSEQREAAMREFRAGRRTPHNRR